MSLDQYFISKMQDIYAEFKAYDASQSERLDRYRNIEPESAYFLAMLIRIQQSKRILEIGTSTGYSTLWLADAAQVTQAKLITLEIDPDRTVKAQHYAKALKLDHVIDFRVVDAGIFLRSFRQKFDFIVLDAERDAYVDYWVYLQHLLEPKGGVLIIDNVISHAHEVQAILELIENDSRFISTTLTIGAGLLMVTFKD